MAEATSKQIDDGGPAFPTSGFAQIGDQLVPTAEGGMSKRDVFAALAMCGLIASDDEGAGDRIGEVPDYAYQIADAMLAARKRGDA